jgi:hypothetical protein
MKRIRSIASVFKQRVYHLAPGESPEQILIAIAEQEFDLKRMTVPEAARGRIVQMLDTPHATRQMEVSR